MATVIKNTFISFKNIKLLYYKHLLLGFGFSGIAIMSMAIGALLALSLSETPLRQARLTPEEEAVFNKEDSVTFDSLQIPKLSRPVNILVLGIKVSTADGIVSPA